MYRLYTENERNSRFITEVFQQYFICLFTYLMLRILYLTDSPTPYVTPQCYALDSGELHDSFMTSTHSQSLEK